EESEERELRAPRRLDLARHVAGIRERLEATRRISETFDRDVVEAIVVGQSRRGGGHHAGLDTFAAQGRRQLQNKRAGRVARLTRKGVRQKENFHSRSLIRSALSSSS